MSNVFMSPLCKEDLSSVRVRTALTVFRKTLEYIGQFHESISCLRNHSETLLSIATSLSTISVMFIDKEDVTLNFQAFQDATQHISEFEGILSDFKRFLSHVHSVMENKQITFDHLEVLEAHYRTYRAIHQCVSAFLGKLDCLITEQVISQAMNCVGRIEKQLVNLPIHPQLEGYVITHNYAKYIITKHFFI